MEQSVSNLIYQETNPYGSMTAFLEDDGRTVYLYLQSEFNPEFKMKALWIKNRIPSPESRTESDLKLGLAPLLCKGEVTSDMTEEEIKKEDVHLIWTEEGDGLGLFWKEKLIAFLPPWSGLKGIHGYSKYAAVDSITANSMGDAENGGVIADRIRASEKYWEFRASEGSWKSVQKLRMDFLEKHLGPHKKYWSADGGKFPPLAIAKFESTDYPDIVLYSTVGMSAQSMPGVELYHKEYTKYSRVELMFAQKKGTEEDRTESWIPHALGELIKFPWMMGKWFGEGHSISIPRKDPNSLYLNFTHFFFTANPPALKTESGLLEAPCLSDLISENGQKISFLFLIPITEEEVYFSRNEGSSSLLKSFSEKGYGWAHDSERESSV